MEKSKYPLEIVLARSLTAIRNKRNITPEQLAKHAGVGSKVIEDIEEERYTPNLITLIRIARALRCSLNDLLPMDEIK